MEFSERQKQIVREAIKIIARQGIQKLTIKNLAASIGISEAALYRHFSSKHDILLGILDTFQEISCFKPGGSVNQDNALNEIKGFFYDRLTKFQADPDLTRVMFSEEVFQYDSELSSKLLGIMNQHADFLKGAIIKAQTGSKIRKDVDSNSIFMVLIGSLRHIVTRWCLAEYDFNLQQSGEELWLNLETLIS